MFQITEKQTFEDGQTIWEEGSAGDRVYLIESGKVELSKMLRGNKVIVKVLQTNELIGDVGYITKGPRTFTTRAVGFTTLGIIDNDFLAQDYRSIPSTFKTILKSIAFRLKEASETADYGREFQRVSQALSLVFKSREGLVKAFTANASGGGLLIKTPKPLSKGKQFAVKLHLPEDPKPIEVECEVVWSRKKTDDPKIHPVGMGVRFIKISNPDRQRLLKGLKLNSAAEIPK